MRILLLFTFLLFHHLIFAQIHFNEICSKNESVLFDDFNDTPDWIELYNASAATIDLGGFYLSDTNDNLKKWQFPAIEIAPFSFLLIYASEQDTLTDFIHTNFKVDAEGETIYLVDKDGISILKELYVPSLPEDHSYGLQEDGNGNYVFFDAPTPGFSNNDSEFYTFASSPIFNLQGQLINEAINIELNCVEPNCQIYYTLDGSPPTNLSLRYTTPIVVEQTSTIRAYVEAPNFRNSTIESNTYFFKNPHNLPIVHISTANDLLFDSETGIFEFGPNAEDEWPFYGANFWEDVELAVHFDFFDTNGNYFSQDVGLKVHGGRSARTVPLKSVRLLAKDEYGKEVMEYPFFEDRERTTYKRLVIRNTSGDFYQAYLRDAFLQDYFIQENLDLDVLAARPVVLYYNGQYQGLVFLREKSDKHYLINTYHLGETPFDLLEEDTLINIGNYEAFDAHYDWILSNDLSNPIAYEQAASYFDLENLCDYFITETYVNNTDWLHNNIKYWRIQNDTAKWRYLLFDLDVGLNGRGWTKANVDSFGDKMVQYQDTNRHVNILKAFFQNEDFRHYFINRYADLINTSLSTEKMQSALSNFTHKIDDEIKNHFDKWNTISYEKWDTGKVATVYEFFEDRPEFARQYIQDYFELEQQVELELNVFPPNAGKIYLNTIQIDQFPWKGVYYKGIPVEIRIEANDGFYFQNWQSQQNLIQLLREEEIEVNLSESDVITAIFMEEEEGKDQLPLLYPNPAKEELSIFFNNPKNGEIQFEVYNAIGQKVSNLASTFLTEGLQIKNFNINFLTPGVYILRLRQEDWQESIQFIKPY